MVKKPLLILAGAAMLLSACSGSGSGSPDPKPAESAAASAGTAAASAAPKQPVELSFYMNSITQADFDKYYVAPLKEKFPHITVKGITPVQGSLITELVASGNIPDVLIGTKGSITNQMNGLKLAEDIGPLIKSNNYDIGKLEPVTLDIMQKTSNGKIIGLPLNLSVFALHYNKDLFDKFGVAYPKDGMTWDDVYSLAKQLTREEQGVKYRGFSDRWGDTFFASNPFELPYLDPKEEKSTFLDERWKTVIQNWLRFYTLQGLKFDAKTINKDEDIKVFATGTSAMTVISSGVQDWKFNWDIVSAPTYKEKPGMAMQANARYNFILKGSKKQQAAFEVAAYMTSAEYQSKIAKEGLFPVLKDESVKKQYMENNPLYKGKNLKAYYQNQFAPEPQGRAEGLVNTMNAQDKYLLPEVVKVVLENKDLNTALRDAHEGVAKGLAEAKLK